MAHIDLGQDEQVYLGIHGLIRYRPETGRPLLALNEALLRGPHPLTPGERELIAAYVSGRNECRFCQGAHSAFAAVQLDEGMALVDQVHADLDSAPISAKLRALLHIAGAVQHSGRSVTPELVEAARAEGATDVEIHDTVLIAAAYCMFNRYVDGLGTLAPDDQEWYLGPAGRVATHGYLPVLDR
ncbi:carboxymuconolactone decarboxylase family protein [Micromonospora rubida]|uniref:carboxymuconolactone decarboxylase family protein n=1 Tax=Micromonospora rubida TaxID=2697657 RepID=UPI0013790289|nr:carboxymuconolactone decarboxylase family protein [Micromonospora rubida]NBE85296.1 carboxymuconolactone decarboxylase family protein [Micromonospora rubida]